MSLRDIFWLSIVLLISIYLGNRPLVQSAVKAIFMPAVEPVILSEMQGHLSDFFLNDSALNQSVNRWYKSLSPTAQAGQLIMPAWSTVYDFELLKTLIKNQTVAGFMVLNKEFTPEKIAILKAENPNTVPLFVSIDAEPSLLKYRFNKPVYEKETQDLKSVADIKMVTINIADDLKRFGMNVNFAPVYDLGINESVIGTRAFSNDPEIVQASANLMALGFMQANIMPTAKHFPGHGLVSGDTHLELQTITSPLNEITQFKSAIKAQIPIIMVGHLAVKNETYDTTGLPATLSTIMMKDLLREALGFKGLIITDALNMLAVNEIEDADLKALIAGADIVLMPHDAERLNQKIQALMAEDTDLAREIEQKIKRVLRLKLVWRLSNYK